MSTTAEIDIAVVVAREPVASPWADHAWRPVEAVFPAPPDAEWRLIRETDGTALFLAGTITMELHRREAASYLDNAGRPDPALYVVLRHLPDGDQPLELHLVTASLTDVEAYGEGGDEVVGPVPMPPAVLDLVVAFASEHYVEEKFIKRRRKDYVRDEPEQFGQEPIFERRARERRRRDGGDEI